MIGMVFAPIFWSTRKYETTMVGANTKPSREPLVSVQSSSRSTFLTLGSGYLYLRGTCKQVNLLQHSLNTLGRT